MRTTVAAGSLWLSLSAAMGQGFTAAASPITFDSAFEAGSVGQVEALGTNQFRVHVLGQQDARRRNRQANWYYFRLDGVRSRAVTLTLTDFVGEYNNRPGAVPMTAATRPVFSTDGELWQHFAAMEWDDVRKEATLRFQVDSDRLWVAHVPPYPYSRLVTLLGELARHPHVTVEAMGRSVQGRNLPLVTVTNPDRPDGAKKCVWLMTRQHAWETGTSFVAEGALRFLTSDVPLARTLRERVVFKVTPMLDPDGCALGHVRFNANGYDVNRHWDAVDLQDAVWLGRCPEIWHAKRAIFAQMNSVCPIRLLVNLHNDEESEYLETAMETTECQQLVERLHERLATESAYDPSGPPRIVPEAGTTTNDLWRQRKVPVVLLEQRIAPGAKLGRQPTTADRIEFGRALIRAMAEILLP